MRVCTCVYMYICVYDVSLEPIRASYTSLSVSRPLLFLFHTRCAFHWNPLYGWKKTVSARKKKYTTLSIRPMRVHITRIYTCHLSRVVAVYHENILGYPRCIAPRTLCVKDDFDRKRFLRFRIFSVCREHSYAPAIEHRFCQKCHFVTRNDFIGRGKLKI